MRTFLIDTDTASDDAVAIIMALADARGARAGADDRRRQCRAQAGDAQRAADRGNLRRRRSRLRRRGQAADPGAGATRIGFMGRTASATTAIRRRERTPESEHAVDAIVRLARDEPGLTLVTLGPLTNIALALARDPEIAGKIGRCVVMGGAPCCEGNVTPAAEYNIWVDPEAARIVFRSKLQDRDGRLARLARRLGARRRRHRRDSRRSGRRRRISPSNATAAPARPITHRPARCGLSLADPTAMAVALDRSIGLTGAAIASRSNARAN